MANEFYHRTFTSYSGADIIATFNNKVIGELQGITYSITREKAPIYTFGSPDPRSFSRGKRGIAGNLVFSVFDSDALLEALGEAQVYGWGAHGNANRIGDQIEPNPVSIGGWNTEMEGYLGTGGQLGAPRARRPVYVDEIPPFDVTITFANEYGQMAVMRVFGVEILNEGAGMSIDDVVTERAMTYVARRIESINPLTR